MAATKKRQPTNRQLKEYANRADSSIAKSSRSVLNELTALYADFNKRFSRVLRSKAISQTDTFELHQAVIAMNQLTGILDQAGLSDVLDAYRSEFVTVTQGALDYFKMFGEPPTLSGIDDAVIDGLVDFSQNELRWYVEDKLVSPIRTALIQGTVGLRDTSTVIDEILEISDNLEPHQAQVLVEDTYRRYQRFVRDQKAKDIDLQIVVYIGPDDAKTSEQCEWLLHESPHGVPGMWYASELHAGMDPEGLLKENPLIAGGHWNCRHDFFPVTEEYAVDQGFQIDTNQEV